MVQVPCLAVGHCRRFCPHDAGASAVVPILRLRRPRRRAPRLCGPPIGAQKGGDEGEGGLVGFVFAFSLF
jgi:hypothetical protein